MTYHSYINFSPINIINEESGEKILVAGVSSDEAHEALANRLIEILHNSKYEDWINFNLQN